MTPPQLISSLLPSADPRPAHLSSFPSFKFAHIFFTLPALYPQALYLSLLSSFLIPLQTPDPKSSNIIEHCRFFYFADICIYPNTSKWFKSNNVDIDTSASVVSSFCVRDIGLYHHLCKLKNLPKSLNPPLFINTKVEKIEQMREIKELVEAKEEIVEMRELERLPKSLLRQIRKIQNVNHGQ